MNISLESLPPVVKLCVTNPHTTYARLFLARLLSGKVYGVEQEISVILLSKVEHLQEMEGLKVQLENCAFSLNAGIEVIQDVNKAIKDIHVFILMSVKETLSTLQTTVKEELPATTLDAILDIKAYATSIENMLTKACADGDTEEKTWKTPLVVTDCLTALTIFAHYAADYPRKKLFCSTSLTTVARFVLVTHLDVLNSQLNHIYAWAADNNTIHIEADAPLINFNDDEDTCESTLVQKELLESKDMDRTDFNESWMKSQLLDKTRARAAKDPLGPISSAHTLAALLKDISSLIHYGNKNPHDPEQLCKERDKVPQSTKLNAGILSDGSYNIPTGLPCVFPLIVTDNTWEIDQKHCNSLFVKKVMKQLKGAAKKNYDKIIALCEGAAEQRQDVAPLVSNCDGTLTATADDPSWHAAPASSRGVTLTATADDGSRGTWPASSREEYRSNSVTDHTSGRTPSDGE